MQAPNQITVRVPASSANLGPGFDALGLALGLHLRCTLRRAESGAPLRIQASGEGASEIPTGESNLIWQAFARAAAELVPPSESIAGVLDGRGLELLVENEIPLGRGLGSSAAAIVAGVALANEYCRAERGRGELIEMASRIEGHPDNVAAAVLGGLVVSCQDAQPRVYAVRCPFDTTLIEVIVVVPDFQLATSKARAALPAQYTRADAVYNVQRAALLVAALTTGQPGLLREAVRDRLHQPYRSTLVPGLEEMLRLDGVPGLLGVALSGAGPSVVAFCERGRRQAGEALADCFRRNGVAARILPLPVDEEGLAASCSAQMSEPPTIVKESEYE